MELKSVLFLCLAGLAQVHAEGQRLCGNTPYYPSDYTCFNGKTLCPRISGEETQACGRACYLPSKYKCTNGKLYRLQAGSDNAEGASAGTTSTQPSFDKIAFSLEVESDSPALNKLTAEVCKQQFEVGADADTCAHCFHSGLKEFDCASYTNECLLRSSGAMDVTVPGGQAWYVDLVTGRLKTTAAGKAGGTGRNLAGKNVSVGADGYFTHVASTYWLACKEQGGKEVYGIFAPMTKTNANLCEKIKLKAVPHTGHKKGAYMYV